MLHLLSSYDAAYYEFARSILDSARANTVVEFGTEHSLKDLPTKEVWFKMEIFPPGANQGWQTETGLRPRKRAGISSRCNCTISGFAAKGSGAMLQCRGRGTKPPAPRQLTCLETLINLDKNQSFLNLLTKFIEVRAHYAQRNSSATHIPDLMIRNSQEGVEIASVSFPAEATTGCLQKATVTIFRHDDSPTFLINQDLNSWGENIIKLTDAFGGEPHVLLREVLNALTILKNHLKLLNPLNTLTNTPHRHKPLPT